MALCVLVEGFFSGSEIAVVSVNRAKLRHLVNKGSTRAKILDRILKKPEWLLSTTLLGTNLATLMLNAVATLYVVQNFGEKYEMATIIVTWPLMLVLGEAIPKALYQRHADKVALYVIVPLQIISWVLSPFIWMFCSIARLAARIGGFSSERKSPLLTKEELQSMYLKSAASSTAARAGKVKDLESSMIDRIFSFSDQEAEDIMIPLINLISIRDDVTISAAADIMRKSGFSRLPVYSDRVYNIIGWVNQYDLLLAKDRAAKVKTKLRKVRYVPETMLVDHLLITMQRAGESLAFVVDEYGGATGLVTLEDILEEIVGEIEDEYDIDETYIRELENGQLIVNARIPIDELNEKLPQVVPQGEYETLGGYLATKMQKIPLPGEEYRVGRLRYRILKTTERTVEEVEIHIS